MGGGVAPVADEILPSIRDVPPAGSKGRSVLEHVLVQSRSRPRLPTIRRA